jgi:cytochrome c-type biogenesis protein CcmH/NrfG
MVALVVIVITVVFLALTIPFIPRWAMDMMGILLQDRPDDADGWFAYGKLLDWRGHDYAAVEAYRSAVTYDPSNKDAWRRLGDLLTELGDFEGADNSYRMAT